MNTCKALIIVTSLISLMLGVLFYFHFHDSLIPCILLLPLKDEHIELFYSLLLQLYELCCIDHVGTIL